MSYIEESLSAGEKVESLFRLHWFSWLPVALWLLLGVVTFGLMGVTNKRVILKTGIIGRRASTIPWR